MWFLSVLLTWCRAMMLQGSDFEMSNGWSSKYCLMWERWCDPGKRTEWNTFAINADKVAGRIATFTAIHTSVIFFPSQTLNLEWIQFWLRLGLILNNTFISWWADNLHKICLAPLSEEQASSLFYLNSLKTHTHVKIIVWVLFNIW